MLDLRCEVCERRIEGPRRERCRCQCDLCGLDQRDIGPLRWDVPSMDALVCRRCHRDLRRAPVVGAVMVVILVGIGIVVWAAWR